MKKIMYFFLAALVVVCASISTAVAQSEINGKIVFKESGEYVAYAAVSARSASDGAYVTGCVSDDKGLFSIRGLKAGTYDITSKFGGYHDVTVRVELKTDDDKIELNPIALPKKTGKSTPQRSK